MSEEQKMQEELKKVTANPEQEQAGTTEELSDEELEAAAGGVNILGRKRCLFRSRVHNANGEV